METLCYTPLNIRHMNRIWTTSGWKTDWKRNRFSIFTIFVSVLCLYLFKSFRNRTSRNFSTTFSKNIKVLEGISIRSRKNIILKMCTLPLTSTLITIIDGIYSNLMISISLNPSFKLWQTFIFNTKVDSYSYVSINNIYRIVGTRSMQFLNSLYTQS